jgi:hydroxymethylglutaryl-CoA lyase
MFQLANGRFRTVGVVSVAFGCPFEGVVEQGRLVEDVGRFVDLGVTMVSLGDTIGVADPQSVRSMIARLDREYPGLPVVLHFHNTRGTGIANAIAALEAGCRNFDTAMGGIGGHPTKITYGSGTTGNVCTEDFVSLLESMGIETGVDIELLEEASRACEAAFERPLYSLVARAGF